MPKANRATAAEIEMRVNKVFECLVAGMTRFALWQYVTTNEKAKLLFNGVSKRQLDRYIADASAMIAAEAEYLRPKEIGKAVARLNAIFQGAIKVQDYKTGIAAQRELNHLLSLYEPPAAQTLNINTSDAALLSELLDNLKARGIPASVLFQSALLELAESEAAENEHE